jgi:dipeptidase E
VGRVSVVPPTVNRMNLLLLSLGIDAVPAFLAETAPAHPRIGYLGAAAGDAPWAVEERARIDALGHPVIDVDLSAGLPEIDVLYVAGGNTFVLLDALRRTGQDRVVADRVRAGLPYIGLSAGSIVTGPSVEPATVMDDRSEAPGLTDLAGLALIPDVVLPHADGKLPPYPPELIARTVAEYGAAHRLLPLADDQALRVTDDGWDVIESR